MPGPDGRLSPEELRTVGAYFDSLEKKAGRELPCDVCGQTLWNINPFLLGFVSDAPNMMNSPRFRTPTVMLHCHECGNEKFFIAWKTGIMPLGAQEEAPAEDEEKDNV